MLQSKEINLLKNNIRAQKLALIKLEALVDAKAVTLMSDGRYENKSDIS